MRRQPSRNRLNCFCSRHPLLAIYGNDENGKPYVHVRIFKQGRIFGDVVVYGGEVKICCRECIRWHRITFVGEQKEVAELVQTEIPAEVDSNGRIVQAGIDEG